MIRYKKVKGFPNYLIGEEGSIWSLRANKYLKQSVHSNGYLLVTLCNKGTRKSSMLHQIVAKAFLPNPENKPQINHKDSDKSNNDISNLEWCTSSENHVHKWRNIGVRGARWDRTKGNWRVDVWAGNKLNHIGNFKDKKLAQDSYEFAYTLIHGEYPW